MSTKFLYRCVTVVMLFAWATIAAGQSGAKFRRYHDNVPGQYIVVLAETHKPHAASLAQSLSKKHNGKVIGLFDRVLGGFGVELPEAVAIKLSEEPGVDSVHEVVRMYPTGSGLDTARSWGLDRVDVRYQAEMDGQYAWSYSGDGVVAYVLDSGINNVGDLAGRIDAHMQCWSADASCQSSTWGATYGEFDVDYDGHGTPVASILGGSLFGVARTVRFKDVQIWSAGVGQSWSNTNNLIKALNWVVNDHVGRDASGMAKSVANISHQYPGTYDAVDIAVRDAVAAGITVVVGAGNDGVDACTRSPARAGNPNMIPSNPNGFSAITVGATNRFDSVVTFANTNGEPVSWASNGGQCVDIFAPGHDLRATGRYGTQITFQGTSAATPHVAGLAAIRLEKYGFLDPAAVESSIKSWATSNVLTNLPANSPNLLLYTMQPRTRICCSY